jgi:HEAT repeat protein
MRHRRYCHGLLLGLTLLPMLAGCKPPPDAGAADPVSRQPLSAVEQSTLREEAIDLLLESAASERAEARANALEALQQVPGRSREMLRMGLHDPNLAVRYVAAVNVGELEQRDLAREVRRLVADPNDSVQAAALFALHRCGEPIDISPLSTLLMQPDPTTRANVAFLLGELGNASAMQMLRDAARAEMPRVGEADAKRVQLQIAESLAKLGDDEALEPIRAALYAPPEQGELQALAATMLGRLGDERSVDSLIQLASRKEEFLSAEVRLACAASLAQLGRPQGAFVADMYCASERPALRAQSAYVYGQIGSPANLRVLRRMMQDSSEIVRIYAAAAVVRITSR